MIYSAKRSNAGSPKRSLAIALIDACPIFLAFYLILYINPSYTGRIPWRFIWIQMGVGACLIYLFRLLLDIYRQIWRFGSIPPFIRLICADFLACASYSLLGHFLFTTVRIRVIQAISIFCLILLMSLTMRLVYAFLYQYSGIGAGRNGRGFRFLGHMVNLLVGKNDASQYLKSRRIRVALIGAGRVGVQLAEDLLTNPNAPYIPVVFLDNDLEKVGRRIFEIPVYSSDDREKILAKYAVQEIILTIPDATLERKSELYELYKQSGCKIKTFDYPLGQSEQSDKPVLREFDISDLLYRSNKNFLSDSTKAFFTDKVVLITGGGGSIGSELCRQIARMKPRKLIVLDVYENNAYDIQQELRIAYGAALDFSVEIFSVTDKVQLEACFEKYHPEVVLHAAAHKHVPLMEHNVCEAVANNVFGTLNVVKTAEKFGVKKFIMISTDKAVNPTNVMGATKRMCEMIVLSHAACDDVDTSFSCTRFGNVLGSNGSVIPLFKRQIAAGGPVTITDKRIIRYFMTIPEASQLVLTSGAMAKNGELFVLDMGKPVKIYDLAVNMIRLSGLKPNKDIAIAETGLRPGEKLFEELLIKTEDLDKTDNELIFVERQSALSRSEVEEKLEILRAALATNDNDTVRAALHQVVPTFKTPEEVNALAEKAEEMKMNN